MKRRMSIAVALLVVAASLGVAAARLEQRAVVEAPAGVQAPRFEVDPLWPKPLPNNWILGQTIGVAVDAQRSRLDHPPRRLARAGRGASPRRTPRVGECCAPAPPVLEFDPAGNLVGHWGGPGQGYDWPDSNHGITVDYKGNVWIGGNGRGSPPAAAITAAAGQNREQDESQVGGVQAFNDNMVLKFTRDGKFLVQIGKPHSSKGRTTSATCACRPRSSSTRRPTKPTSPTATATTASSSSTPTPASYKRHWGAYGNKPDDAISAATIRRRRRRSSSAIRCTAPISRSTACSTSATASTTASRCSRPTASSSRKRSSTARRSARGSVWDVAFSKDPQQKLPLPGRRRERQGRT